MLQTEKNLLLLCLASQHILLNVYDFKKSQNNVLLPIYFLGKYSESQQAFAVLTWRT